MLIVADMCARDTVNQLTKRGARSCASRAGASVSKRHGRLPLNPTEVNVMIIDNPAGDHDCSCDYEGCQREARYPCVVCKRQFCDTHVRRDRDNLSQMICLGCIHKAVAEDSAYGS